MPSFIAPNKKHIFEFRKFDYDRSLLPNPHLRELESGVSDLEEAYLKSGLSIGYPGWGMIYYLVLCHMKPGARNVIIETGTNYGCTTIVLAQALRDSGCDGHVYTFEMGEGECERARQNIGSAGLADRVTIVQGDTRETLPALLDENGPVRFCFIDANHSMQGCLREFEVILPHAAPDALMLFDNTFPIAEPESKDQRVNGALKAIVQRHGGNLINLEFVSWAAPGLAIWQRQPAL